MRNGARLSEEVRSGVLGAVDLLRGAKLRTEILAVERHYRGSSGSSDCRRRQLEELLEFSVSRVPYYRNRSGLYELAGFPVVSKETIRNHWEQFRASGFRDRDLSVVTTSGSSGEPFECLHDPRKRRRKLADLIVFNSLVGYRVGMRHMLIRATPKSRLKQWAQNQVWVDPTKWNDDLRRSVRRTLLSGKVRVVIGYPSIVSDLAAYCQSKGNTPKDFGLLAYISTSEVISRSQRSLVSNAFGCDVVSRYATEECGVLGQTRIDSSRFHVNTGSCVVEILGLDSDESVRVGELGRVVVSDLYLRGMPLIRYDTGDLARSDKMADDGIGAGVLRSLEGKSTEVVYDTRGHQITPLAILVALKEARGIQRFQFAQLSEREYELRVFPTESGPDMYLEDKLKEILGADAVVTFSVMEKIPAQVSGKRPSVVNEMNRAVVDQLD